MQNTGNKERQILYALGSRGLCVETSILANSRPMLLVDKHLKPSTLTSVPSPYLWYLMQHVSNGSPMELTAHLFHTVTHTMVVPYWVTVLVFVPLSPPNLGQGDNFESLICRQHCQLRDDILCLLKFHFPCKLCCTPKACHCEHSFCQVSWDEKKL